MSTVAEIICLPAPSRSRSDLELAAESLDNAKAHADQLTRSIIWLDFRLQQLRERVLEKAG